MVVIRTRTRVMAVFLAADLLGAQGCRSVPKEEDPHAEPSPLVAAYEPAEPPASRALTKNQARESEFRVFDVPALRESQAASTGESGVLAANSVGEDSVMTDSSGGRSETSPAVSDARESQAEAAVSAQAEGGAGEDRPANSGDQTPAALGEQVEGPRVPAWRSGPVEGILSPLEVREASLPDDWMKPVDIAADDPVMALIGAWRQTGGSNQPDFAIGGYGESMLYFTGRRSLVVVRKAGDFGARAVFEFSVGDDSKLRLTAPDDAPESSPIRRALIIPGKGSVTHRVMPPLDLPPCTVDYSVTEQTLSIDGKTYRRVKGATR